MNKRIAVVFVLFGLVFSSIVQFCPVEAASDVLVVPDEYSTIQAAINSASDGDEVFVKSGTYIEELVVTKALSLVGEDKDSTIVDGNGTTALLIKHDNVNVTGFTFKRQSTMRWFYGVHLLNVKNCNIFGNKIETTFYGIWLVDSSFNNIYENTLSGDWNGIYLAKSHNNNVSKNTVTGSNDWGISTDGSNNNLIMNNYVASVSWGGIGLDGSSPNCNNLIAGNTVTQCGDIGIGITSSGSSSNTIVGNEITSTGSEDGGDFGIRLAADNNLVIGNRIIGNQGGIYIEASKHNTIRLNQIENNTQGAIKIHSYPSSEASNNVIYENNIINNHIVITGNIQLNTWYSDSRGNYWSTYTGVDNNHDGIGDTPYLIDSSNIDNYPLMNPTTTATDITEFLPSPSPSPSPSPTASPTPSPTLAPTPTPSPTASPTPTASPSLLPLESSKPQETSNSTAFIVITATIILIAVVCAVILLLRKLH